MNYYKYFEKPLSLFSKQSYMCVRTAVLEKISESPLDSKEIKPVNLKGYQSWKLIGRTNAEAEAPTFWSSDVNRWLIGKFPDAGKDWGRKESRMSEDEMAGWHHRCNGHELGQTSGDGEGKRGLARGGKESDKTGWLNNSMSYFSVRPVLGMYHTDMCAYMLQNIYTLMCFVTLFKALIAARWRQAQSLSMTE